MQLVMKSVCQKKLKKNTGKYKEGWARKRIDKLFNQPSVSSHKYSMKWHRLSETRNFFKPHQHFSQQMTSLEKKVILIVIAQSEELVVACRSLWRSENDNGLPHNPLSLHSSSSYFRLIALAFNLELDLCLCRHFLLDFKI